ncbi:MAG: ribonuclease P protein component [Verrucomicrobia bacterium]|nr:ribonuclease P protein component [Verrucomicrobiota bacterium]
MIGGSSDFRFRPGQHLKRGGEFAKLKAHGNRLTTPMFILNWLPRQVPGPSRLGVVTGKRLGIAVERNRARRLLREAFRLIQGEIRVPVDLVLVARQAIREQKLNRVLEELRKALLRAGIRANAGPAAGPEGGS